ncbi:MAG TPA: hypothetical protein VF982_11190 [Anaerolineales bacterium]|jgi:hypothetical protein
MADKRPNPQVLIISAIVGAVVGVAAGMTLLKRAETDAEERPMLTAAEGMSLGMLVVGLLRQIANIGAEKKK